MNPDLQINALTERVSPETVDVFDDSFWSSLDMVLNALDNIAVLSLSLRHFFAILPLLISLFFFFLVRHEDMLIPGVFFIRNRYLRQAPWGPR